MDNARKIKLVFIDEGKAFDMLDRETPDLSVPIEERTIGGLGIHLVKTLMDDVSYIRNKNQNVLSIIKNI